MAHQEKKTQPKGRGRKRREMGNQGLGTALPGQKKGGNHYSLISRTKRLNTP